MNGIFRFGLVATALLGVAGGTMAATIYQPTEASLSQHTAPEWWRDAKLGIFVHWGLYSVPAYAPREAQEFDVKKADQNKRFNPYAEWYYNTLLIKGSPTELFHRNAYGADFNYYDFAKTFRAASKGWNPDNWASLFSQTGAGYVVLTTKHHDGFTLWPSEVINPHLSPGKSQSDRDLVGELTTSVRSHGMKMGFYYSGLYDWSFKPGPIMDSVSRAQMRTQSPEYVKYADAQWRELISKYQPDILWNDIGYNPGSALLQISADYYNAFPQGLINNRWKPYQLGDFATPEYAKLDHISQEPWETCRGLGKSFGLNRIEGPEETITPVDLVHLLVDIVSKNGNLLLDVGPEPDGTIPAIQTERLNQLGGWLKQNGEAIFGTRPWTRSVGSTRDGVDVRFTRKDGALFAILLHKPAGRTVTLIDVPASSTRVVATLLGSPGPLAVQRDDKDLTITLPATLPGDYAWAVRLDGVVHQPSTLPR